MKQPDAAKSPALGTQSRKSLGMMFLILFLDLIGFSIIFPLFPNMLEFYRIAESDTGLFAALYRGLEALSQVAGLPASEWGIIVLFGGILGSLYSLLQFFFSPIFGTFSDRVGRKPVLLVALGGLLVSYVLWFFAGSFWLLVAARILGGIMSANISTATAVVADVTTPQTRAKGMAFIGIAFGIGFIVGPALGGAAALIDLSAWYPGLAAYGVNPFSMAAAAAALLTVVNLVVVIFFFQETLPESGPEGRPVRKTNPLALLRTFEYPGVTANNWAYFMFLVAFSGMEFSLTFLAVERLGFTPMQNATLFLFIGIVLSFIQGGYVPRAAHRFGSRAVATHGLLCIVPALIVVGLAGHYQQTALLYGGLFLLAIGGAQTLPSLTALASLYAPEHDQGRILGIFRSLGALARALGPLVACVLYWRLGGSATYYLGAIWIIIPLVILRILPSPASLRQSSTS